MLSSLGATEYDFFLMLGHNTNKTLRLFTQNIIIKIFFSMQSIFCARPFDIEKKNENHYLS
jgi:hypothetical protein